MRYRLRFVCVGDYPSWWKIISASNVGPGFFGQTTTSSVILTCHQSKRRKRKRISLRHLQEKRMKRRQKSLWPREWYDSCLSSPKSRSALNVRKGRSAKQKNVKGLTCPRSWSPNLTRASSKLVNQKWTTSLEKRQPKALYAFPFEVLSP